jgi:hypothetical protein
MLKRYGGPAERLLLIGCCLMPGEIILNSFQTVLRLWYIAKYEVSAPEIAIFSLYISIPLSLLTLSGIVCLIVAFWKRWKTYGPSVSRQTNRE